MRVRDLGHAQPLPDFSPTFGKRFDARVVVRHHNGAEVEGHTWEIVGQNDLHVPYVSRRVRYGNTWETQRRQYAGPVFTRMCRRILEGN